jgi:hypothetical protein
MTEPSSTRPLAIAIMQLDTPLVVPRPHRRAALSPACTSRGRAERSAGFHATEHSRVELLCARNDNMRTAPRASAFHARQQSGQGGTTSLPRVTALGEASHGPSPLCLQTAALYELVAADDAQRRPVLLRLQDRRLPLPGGSSKLSASSSASWNSRRWSSPISQSGG